MPWFRWPTAPITPEATATTAVTLAPPRPPEVPHTRFTPEHLAVLSELYWATGCGLDSLPYTDAFDDLCGHFLLKTGLNCTRHTVWRALVGHRKAGKLRRPDADDAADD